MDAASKQELKRAYAYLKSGDRKSASQILVSLLKHDSEIEEAWLLLSLAVDDRNRQVYALQQVLRLNPDNAKARDRLAGLTGAPSAPPARPTAQPEPAYGREDAEDDAPFDSSEGDLLSSRLFGEAAPAGAGGFSEEPAEEDDQPFEPIEPEAPSKKERRPKRERQPGGRRRLMPLVLLVLLLVILLGGGYFAWTSGLLASILPQGGGEPGPGPSATATAAEPEFALPPTWTPTVFVTATPTHTLTPSPLPSPTSLNEVLPASVQERVVTLDAQVASVRGITAVPEIGRALVSQSALEELVRARMQDDAFFRRSGDITHIYATFGLIFPGANLHTYYANSQVQPFGGLFAPEGNALYLVALNFEARHEYAYAHLYDLALIDALVGLDDLGLAPDCRREADECRALNALVQGDATLTRQLWATRYLPKVQAADVRALDDLTAFIADLNAPLFAEADLRFPYVQGLAFVQSLYDEGGWEAVDLAYTSPPLTTEQILHPDKYLAGEQAVEVIDPLVGAALPGWRLLEQSSLGEWLTYLVLGYNVRADAPVGLEAAAAAAAGWGGDGYQVYYQDSTSQTALAAHWVFDTPEDAEEFDAALALMLSGRFPGAPAEAIDAICYGSAPIACTALLDAEVYWLIAPDAASMNGMLDALGLGGS
ncbi:MAG: hypothetical protein HYZ26_05860 [Chloroflexi bacterium]|nr:hypothetical protein [Chloroflexota bacterium]